MPDSRRYSDTVNGVKRKREEVVGGCRDGVEDREREGGEGLRVGRGNNYYWIRDCSDLLIRRARIVSWARRRAYTCFPQTETDSGARVIYVLQRPRVYSLRRGRCERTFQNNIYKPAGRTRISVVIFPLSLPGVSHGVLHSLARRFPLFPRHRVITHWANIVFFLCSVSRFEIEMSLARRHWKQYARFVRQILLQPAAG